MILLLLLTGLSVTMKAQDNKTSCIPMIGQAAPGFTSESTMGSINFDEIKRTLVSLQFTKKFNVLTPANWQPGNDALIHIPKTLEESEKMTDREDPDLYSVIWYMWFRKMK